MKHFFMTLWVGAFIILLGGCTSQTKKDEIKDADIVAESYTAADMLMSRGRDRHLLVTSKPLLVASFVNVDNVQTSSTLGRIVAEQIGSRFAQHGHRVIEVKLRSDSIFTKGNSYNNEGEYILSREIQDISRSHNAYAIVAGTYAASKRYVYVTAKVIRTSDGVIISSHDYRLPMGPDTKRMVRTSR